MARKTPQAEIVPAANLCYGVGKLCQLVTLYAVELELLPLFVLPELLAATVLAAVFLLVGIRIRSRLPAQHFRRLLLTMIFLLALFVGYRGWLAWLA